MALLRCVLGVCGTACGLMMFILFDPVTVVATAPLAGSSAVLLLGGLLVFAPVLRR